MSNELPQEALDAEDDGGQEVFSSPSDPAEIDGEVENEGQADSAPEGSATDG